MIYTKMILTVSVFAVIAFNSMFVGAGKATDLRKKNLMQRASVHTDTLKKNEKLFKGDGDRTLSDSIAKEVTNITEVILTHMMKSKEFKKYLKSIFKKLKRYAVGQIAFRENKLETVYEKWEKAHFPDPAKKEEAKKLMKKKFKENESEEKIKKKKQKNR